VNSPWVYIALVGLALIVYSRFLPRRGNAPEQWKQEMEETIGQFAAELEADNKEIVQLLSTMRKEHEAKVNMLAQRIDFLERQAADYSQRLAQLAAAAENKPLPARAEPLPKPPHEPAPPVEPAPDSAPSPVSMTGIRERYAELFQLYDQNKSIDYIARKLGMNKGEVGLILELARQEERFNV